MYIRDRRLPAGMITADYYWSDSNVTWHNRRMSSLVTDVTGGCQFRAVRDLAHFYFACNALGKGLIALLIDRRSTIRAIMFNWLLPMFSMIKEHFLVLQPVPKFGRSHLTQYSRFCYIASCAIKFWATARDTNVFTSSLAWQWPTVILEKHMLRTDKRHLYLDMPLHSILHPIIDEMVTYIHGNSRCWTENELVAQSKHRKRLIKRETLQELIEMQPTVHFTDSVSERSR